MGPGEEVPMKIRGWLYWLARLLGDVGAVRKTLQGKPNALVRRVGNKWLGRMVLRRFWF